MWFVRSNHLIRNTSFDPNYEAPLPDNLSGQNEGSLWAFVPRLLGVRRIRPPWQFLLLTWSRIPAYFWLAPSEESTLTSNLGRLLSFAVFSAFMLYGLLLSRQQWRLCLPLFAYIAFDTTLHLISWAAPRYRLPSDTLMMVFEDWPVSTGLVELAGSASQKPSVPVALLAEGTLNKSIYGLTK